MNSEQNITSILSQQHEFFNTGATRSEKFRREQLKQLRKMIIENEAKILEAIKQDLHKPDFENKLTETQILIWEIDFVLKNLSEWMSPQKVTTPLFHQPATSKIVAEPLGTTLIIAPWNYPFQLLIAPLIASIAAGNTTVLKPSEVSIHTSNMVAELIEDYFKNDYIAVVEGAVDATTKLLDLNWDLIFYTGNTSVGKIVMQAAAKHLTPVILELGGKSPCIVDKKTNIKQTAHKIAWGKFLNAGQTCIAPDYIFVDQAIKEEFIKELTTSIKKYYTSNPANSSDYARIINTRHFNRLVRLISDVAVVFGGKNDEATNFIEPTVIDNPPLDSEIMKAEIFGPLLPIIPYFDKQEVIDYINRNPKPLALYIFSKNSSFVDEIVLKTSSGGVCVNDTISHITSPYLPFGGVGDSGMGQYHGKKGFESFSHLKSVMVKSQFIDMPFRYPPYIKLSKGLLKLFKWIN